MSYPEFAGANRAVPNVYVPDYRHVAVLTGLPQALAALGSTIADAAPILYTSSLVSGADATKGVALPTPVDATRTFIVINNAAAVLKVYPPGTHSINNAGAGVAFSAPANSITLFFYVGGTLWFAK